MSLCKKNEMGKSIILNAPGAEQNQQVIETSISFFSNKGFGVA